MSKLSTAPVTPPPQNDVLDWAIVRELLKPRGRGAAYQLATRLGINPSFLYRKLKSGGEISERRARLIRDFLFHGSTIVDGQHRMASEPGRLMVFGAHDEASDRIKLRLEDAIDTLQLPFGLDLNPAEFFVVQKRGSYMIPRIYPGELLVVRRNYPPVRGKDVLIEFPDGTASVRLYEGERAGLVHVAELAPEHRIVTFDATAIRAMHAIAFRL